MTDSNIGQNLCCRIIHWTQIDGALLDRYMSRSAMTADSSLLQWWWKRLIDCWNNERYTATGHFLLATSLATNVTRSIVSSRIRPPQCPSGILVDRTRILPHAQAAAVPVRRLASYLAAFRNRGVEVWGWIVDPQQLPGRPRVFVCRRFCVVCDSFQHQLQQALIAKRTHLGHVFVPAIYAS